MTENTALWDKLGKTDPKHTKSFKRGGGFTGTAIKPMWSYRRLTEEFGPCGVGWGVHEPVFQVVSGHNHEILVFCTVSAWYRLENELRPVTGVGGDKIVSHIKANEQYKRPERWENDDEAFKKAFTDAVTNAFKFIGVGADVHMGMFDDNKYVNSMREEFDEDAQPQKRVSSASLKRETDPLGDPIWTTLRTEIGECQSTVRLRALYRQWRQKAEKDGWPRAWVSALEAEFTHEAAVMKEREEHTVNSGGDALPGDVQSNPLVQNYSAM